MSPLPEAKQREIQLAALIEAVMKRDLAFDPGRRTSRDARDGSGLRVDFTYDGSRPPLALEITGPQDQETAAALAKIRKAERKLTKLAQAESWGHFAVGVYEHANANKLGSTIAEAIRDMIANGREQVDVDFNYGAEYAKARALGLAEEFVRRHEVLRAAGLQLIRKVDVPQDGVRITMASGGVETGVLRTVNRAINNNRAKLAEARGSQERQTHLVVDLAGLAGVSPLLDIKRSPSLNHDVDMLWIVDDANPRNPHPVWSARRGDRTWRLHQPIADSAAADRAGG